VGAEPRVASSAGRRSSTSATGRCGPTSASTPRSPRRCSNSPWGRSQGDAAPHPSRTATYCAGSPGRFPRASGSRGRWAPALSPSDLSELAGYGLGLERATPLWYYILKEAQVTEDGLRLGPVGGGIVAEVFVGLLELDESSYLNQNGWRPTLPSQQRGEFTMVDFLRFAGVDPASRGQ